MRLYNFFCPLQRRNQSIIWNFPFVALYYVHRRMLQHGPWLPWYIVGCWEDHDVQALSWALAARVSS